MLTLEETIGLILKHRSDYERSDILELIEEKRQELGADVINDESAAMIVARELGVDLQRASPRGRTKIEDIKEPSKSVSLVGKIVGIGDVKTFQKKDGSGEGKLASLEVADETGRIRLVLWDDRTEMLKEDVLEEGLAVQIIKAYVRSGLGDTLELHLGRMGGIKPLEPDEIEELGIDLDNEPEVEYTKVSDLELGTRDASVKVVVRWVSDVTEFDRKDGSTGRVMRIFGADETGSVGIVFWDDRVDDAKGMEKGEVVAIERGYTRENQRNNEVELHTGRFSTVRRGLDEEIEASSDSPAKTESKPLGMTAIEDLKTGMWDVDIEGQVDQINDVHTFTRKDDSEGRVQNLVLVDRTARIRAVFWDDDIDTISEVKRGDVIRIKHGYVKAGFMQTLEIVAGRKSEIEVNPENSKLIKVDLSDVTDEPTYVAERIDIEEITDTSGGKTVEVSGIIVNISQSSPIYQACPDCTKKLEHTDEGFTCRHCKKDVEEPIPRMFYKITVDDGTETIRVTLFSDKGAEKLLGMTAKEANELILKTGSINEPIRRKKNQILGRRVRVVGALRKYRDSLEVTASGIDFIVPMDEIERLNESLRKEVA